MGKIIHKVKVKKNINCNKVKDMSKTIKSKTIKLKEPIEIDWSLWNQRLGYPLSKEQEKEFEKYLTKTAL